MLNNNLIWTNPFGSSRSAGGSSSRLNQVYLTRQTRQEARAGLRQGNWDDYLLMPTALLWLESAPVMCFGDECVITPPAIVDLWP